MWQTLNQRRQFQQNLPQFEPAVAYFITDQHHRPDELNEFRKPKTLNRLSEFK
jgi:hypothetical protein